MIDEGDPTQSPQWQGPLVLAVLDQYRVDCKIHETNLTRERNDRVPWGRRALKRGASSTPVMSGRFVQ